MLLLPEAQQFCSECLAAFCLESARTIYVFFCHHHHHHCSHHQWDLTCGTVEGARACGCEMSGDGSCMIKIMTIMTITITIKILPQTFPWSWSFCSQTLWLRSRERLAGIQVWHWRTTSCDPCQFWPASSMWPFSASLRSPLPQSHDPGSYLWAEYSRPSRRTSQFGL